MNAPSPFSKHNPKLQLAWDSTSLRALQFCPRFYEYSILEGWSGSSVDLEFGIMAHSALETYDRARVAGATRDVAQLAALRVAMEVSVRRTGFCESCNEHVEVVDDEGTYFCAKCGGGHVSDVEWHPWGGDYVQQWRCTGTEPYKNAKGNKAKCPYSHKGRWEFMDPPSICGECGSEIEVAENWVPEDGAKNRMTLIRLVCWYCEEQPENVEDGLKPYTFPDGTVGIEYPFRVPLGMANRHGEAYLMCGYIDRFVEFGEDLFTTDRKTTKKTLNRGYFDSHNPSTQFDTYDLVGSIIMAEKGEEREVRGLLVDAAQTMVEGARFGTQAIYRTELQREEFLGEFRWWVNQAEEMAETGYWPMNRSSCWLCAFKGVCSREPERRPQLLEADFKKRFWNPMEER